MQRMSGFCSSGIIHVVNEPKNPLIRKGAEKMYYRKKITNLVIV